MTSEEIKIKQFIFSIYSFWYSLVGLGMGKSFDFLEFSPEEFRQLRDLVKKHQPDKFIEPDQNRSYFFSIKISEEKIIDVYDKEETASIVPRY